MTRSLCAGAGVLRASILWTLMYLLGNLPRAGGYIVLTKEGYAVEHKLLAQAGARVSDNLTIHGVAISTPSGQLRCNPSRRGGCTVCVCECGLCVFLCGVFLLAPLACVVCS